MTFAADDFEVIRKHVEELRKTEGYPRTCPQSTGRLLYDCLRNPVKCSDQCPHQADWVGPNG